MRSQCRLLIQVIEENVYESGKSPKARFSGFGNMSEEDDELEEDFEDDFDEGWEEDFDEDDSE